jgi:hypothetical protein
MAVTSSSPFDLSSNASTNEYLVVFLNPRRFDRLLRKDDFLDEGVAAVFALAGAEVELLGLSFHAGKFTPARIGAWLAERKFTPAADVPILGKSPPPLT